MPYVEDENGNHILDENGNKIEFTIESIDTPNDWKFVHKELIHVNDDGHLDTENRHLVVKDGVNSNHAISLQQLINSMIAVESKITTLLNAFKAELVKGIDEYLNNQVSKRIGRKSGTIAKTNYKWIKILSKDDIKGINTLQEIIVTNTYIRRNNRYHHAKSDLVASSFVQLEFFFDVSFENYYCYFKSHPSDWAMEYFVEYIRIRLPDNNEDDKEKE